MLSINTNNASMAAVNAISKSSSSLSTSMERLATGNRINSSADDAAGKQIANRLTAQSSGMGVALSNINDATAMLQTADSMFDEMSDVLGRMKDLSTQAANGTYSDDDLQAMQDEYSAAIFLIPICISFDTAEKRRYATYLILNRRFSFEF